MHQCYGLPRLDVENRFPFALDAPNAGFRFLMDVGDLLTCNGLVPGNHIVTIRSGDISTQNANIDEIPVFFQCVEDLPVSAGIIGYIESPVQGLQYGDVATFQGWALALNEVSNVEIFVDGVFRWVAQLVNHVVFADPGHTAARRLQADTLEQLGLW